MHDTDRRLEDAPVAVQPPRKNVPVDDAWRARLSPSTEVIISEKAVTFVRGQQAFTISSSEAPKFEQVYADWQGRARE